MGALDGLASGGISAAGGVLQTGISALVSKRQLKRQVKAQKDLSSYQAKLNDDYTRQLAMDSASLDFLSRRRAGLNPYAGEGELSSGIVSNSMPSVDPQSIDVPNIGMLGLQGAMASAQVRNLNAETNKTNAETEWINPLNEAQLAQIDAAISLTDSQEKLNFSNIDLNEQNRQDIKDRLTMAKEQFPQILQQLGLSNQELEKKIQEIDTNIKISTEMLPANLKLATAQAYAAYASGGAAAATARYILDSISLIQPQLQALQRENKIGDATMNLEIAGAAINYQRQHKALEGDQLENDAKSLANQLSRSDMYWSEKSGIQKIDYVFDKVGQIVDIGKNVGIGYGGVQHGLTQRANRAIPKYQPPTVTNDMIHTARYMRSR